MSTPDLEPTLPPSREKLSEPTAQLQTNLLQNGAPGSGRTIHGYKWFLAYSSLLSTVLFYALDGTIVSHTYQTPFLALTVHRLQLSSLR